MSDRAGSPSEPANAPSHVTSSISKQPARLTETVRRLHAIGTTADARRLSPTQRDFVRNNLDEFVSLHREEMETMVTDALARFRAKIEAAGQTLSEEQLEKAENSVRIVMANRFAKAWCELRGVA